MTPLQVSRGARTAARKPPGRRPRWNGVPSRHVAGASTCTHSAVHPLPHVPHCCCNPYAADAGQSGAAKSKAAKKNEKRKAKKAEGPEAGEGPPAARAPVAAAAPAPAAAASESASASAAAASSGGGDAAQAGAALSGPAAAVDRQIKALSKKVCGVGPLPSGCRERMLGAGYK